MKKRCLLCLLALLTLILCLAGVSFAVAEECSHGNSYYAVYLNERQHTYMCDDCHGALGVGEHILSCNSDICLDCGAEGLTFGDRSHDFGETHYNDTHHWSVCTDCGAEHCLTEHYTYCYAMEECWGCYVDGVQIGDVRHNNYTYDSNTTHHFRTCGHCGTVDEIQKHVAHCVAPTTCDTCGKDAVLDGIRIDDVYHISTWEWFHDGQYHWQVCRDCGAEMNKSKHNALCTAPSLCRTCTVAEPETLTVEHKFTTLVKDDTHHWLVCSDCGEIVERGEHYALCVGDPSACCYCAAEDVTCSYLKHENSLMFSDATQHWEYCSTCDSVILEPAEHIGTCQDGDTCCVCDADSDTPYTLPPRHNVTEADVQYDEQYHWWVCADCGEQTGLEAHFAAGAEENCACGAPLPPLRIVQQPVSVVAASGKTAKVSFTAVGEGLTYTWYYKNADADAFVVTTSFTGNSYSVKMNETRNGRQLYCVVTDQQGNTVQTDTVTLTMGTPLKITAQPKRAYALENETAEVSFTAEGDGLTYTWYYKNADGSKFSKTSTFTGNTYTMEMNETRNGRQVYCVVTDRYGNSLRTDTVDLIMRQELKIELQSESMKVYENEKSRIGVMVSPEECTYQWYCQKVGADEFTPCEKGTGALYFFTMTADLDGARFYCLVSDQYGFSIRSEIITLTLGHRLQITRQPQSVWADRNEEVTISFDAVGDGLTYTWYYKNAGARKFSKTTTFTGSFYTTELTDARNGRLIYCFVKDEDGNIEQTKIVGLHIKKPLRITQQPKSVTGSNGQRVAVSFTADGDGLTYTWYYKNAGASKFSKTSTFIGNIYAMDMNATRDGRQVYCVVTDQYGNTVRTDTVTLTMQNTLKITRQPKSVTAARGKTVEVSFEAEGENLTYTWYYKNAGASKFSKTTTFTGNTYSMEMTSARNGLQIYCVVGDMYGNRIQTDTVTLTMGNAAKITRQPASVSAAIGETVEVTFAATGDGLTYTWYYKNAGASKFSKTATFTGNTYSMKMTSARAGRQIYCVVTDRYGNTVQTNTVTLSVAK